MARGKKISPGAEAALGTAIQRDRERQTGNNGEDADEFFKHGFMVYLGKAQQAIPQGGYGNVNIWSGKKGQEADSKLTIQNVFNRFEPLNNGSFCLFGGFDQGFEVILPPAPSQSTAFSCPCTTCSKSNPPTHWYLTNILGVSGQSNVNGLSSFVLSGSGPWQSAPFSYAGQSNVQWVLTTSADPVTLQLTVGSQSIQYRAPLNSWNTNCANIMNLYNPNNLPGNAGVPCQICVVPSDIVVGGDCVACPSTASFTITNAQSMAVTNTTAFAGTFEVGLSVNTSDMSCRGTVTITLPNNNQGNGQNNSPPQTGSIIVFRGFPPPANNGVLVYVYLSDPQTNNGDTGWWQQDPTAGTWPCNGTITINNYGTQYGNPGTLDVQFAT